MSARRNLETLTHSWYGYAVCAALFSIVNVRASGIFMFAVGLPVWAVISGVWLVCTLAFITFLSRRLLARSSAVRTFLLVASGLGSVLGVLGLANEAWTFLHVWSFSLILAMAATAVSVGMNARSFRVLSSAAVRNYCSG